MVSAGGGAVSGVSFLALVGGVRRLELQRGASVLRLYLRRVGARPSRFKAAGDDSYGGHFYDAQTQVNAGSSSLQPYNYDRWRRRV